jgi:hypothetical protein
MVDFFGKEIGFQIWSRFMIAVDFGFETHFINVKLTIFSLCTKNVPHVNNGAREPVFRLRLRRSKAKKDRKQL